MGLELPLIRKGQMHPQVCINGNLDDESHTVGVRGKLHFPTIARSLFPLSHVRVRTHAQSNSITGMLQRATNYTHTHTPAALLVCYSYMAISQKSYPDTCMCAHRHRAAEGHRNKH